MEASRQRRLIWQVKNGMLKILFVCTGNTCRSPMAEALFKKLVETERKEKAFLVLSAGLAVVKEGPASREAEEALSFYGISLQKHRSHQLSLMQIEAADLVLTMTGGHRNSILRAAPEAKGKVFSLGEFAGVPEEVSDPFGGTLEVYRRCAEEIDRLLKKAWPKICNLALDK